LAERQAWLNSKIEQAQRVFTNLIAAGDCSINVATCEVDVTPRHTAA
jgi:hypothetical protein